MNFEMRVPGVAELTEFFGSEPVEHSAEDGYWCYEFTDELGIQVRLSFNIFERSLQTTLYFLTGASNCDCSPRTGGRSGGA